MLPTHPLILALETSGRTAHVAMIRDGRAVVSHGPCETASSDRAPDVLGPPTARGPSSKRQFARTRPGQGSSARLIPDIRQLCQAANFRPQDLDAIAVTVGPGSFTGLRIGIVTAKTLAWALSIPVVGVNTLEAIAWQMAANLLDTSAPNRILHTVLNAQRQQLFVQSFRWNGRTMTPLDSVAIMDRSVWLDSLPTPSIVGGPGLKPLVDALSEHSSSLDVSIAPPELWQPTPTAIGQIAHHRALQGDFDDLWTLVPNYVRPSYAEE